MLNSVISVELSMIIFFSGSGNYNLRLLWTMMIFFNTFVIDIGVITYGHSCCLSSKRPFSDSSVCIDDYLSRTFQDKHR